MQYQELLVSNSINNFKKRGSTLGLSSQKHNEQHESEKFALFSRGIGIHQIRTYKNIHEKTKYYCFNQK